MKLTTSSLDRSGLFHDGETCADLESNRITPAINDMPGRRFTADATPHFTASTTGKVLSSPIGFMNNSKRSAGVDGSATPVGKQIAVEISELCVVPYFKSLGAPVADWGNNANY